MDTLKPTFHSLHTLRSLSSEHIEQLRKLGIMNLGDLLAYQPFRYARYVLAAKDQLLRKEEIVHYIDQAVQTKNLDEILNSSPEVLKDVGRVTSDILKQIGMTTVADVAIFAPFSEAEEIISGIADDDSDPCAPSCIIPKCKKFTRNSKSFISFFKQKEIRDVEISVKNDSEIISQLFSFAADDVKLIYLGYSVSYIQDWIFRGIHLGEPQGSVNLFMGQDTQISVLDWRRAVQAFRKEDTRAAEHLSSTLFHQRAVDEVARATAEEHQYGATSSFGANAATAGSFVAAGAVVGGIGGGISGALAGLVLGNVANAAGGAPTIAGAAVGTAVGSAVGAAAGSLIFSGATTLGFVETDAEGDREIFSESAQNIQQRTVQNSSSLRSFWSNIITQNVQEEQQRIRTDRVTNHNRIHALNALYFEVLNEYQVNIKANDFSAILFLPYKPITFDKEVLRRYWWLIRTLIGDSGLVAALDQHFLTLTNAPSPSDRLKELPKIEDILTENISIDVNLEGSIFEIVKPEVIFQFFSRDNVSVQIVTSANSINLIRNSSPSSNPSFIGNYSTNLNVSINTIEGVRIINNNEEIPLFSEVSFQDISASITVKGKYIYKSVLPNLGKIEDKQIIKKDKFAVNAKKQIDIPWNIGSILRSQFESINQDRAKLEEKLASEQRVTEKINNFLGFLNANKYGFTRFIFQNTEMEQVISTLERVKIDDMALSSIAGTTPIGFCGNHVVLPLRNNCNAVSSTHETFNINTLKLKHHFENFEKLDRANPQHVSGSFETIQGFVEQFLQDITGQARSNREIVFIKRVQEFKRHIDESLTILYTNRGDLNLIANLVDRIATQFKSLFASINTPVVEIDNIEKSELCRFYASVHETLKPKMGKILGTSELSLPSPAVFMEPLLSNAKGAELYDMRRNSHYEILPSPGISATDPNVIRSQDVSLTPNVPPTTLTIQNAPQFPMPASIIAALAEAGKLDLGTLINTNAGTLNSTLSNLSSMATELAKASAQLTGDAQKQALATAGDVAKNVSDIIAKSLKNQADFQSRPIQKVDPPKGQQEKAETRREIDRINNKRRSSPQEKKEKKEAIGAATTPDEKRNYQFSITFLDKDGIPYTVGAFTFSLNITFFELEKGNSVKINGGVPLDLSPDGFFFPETFLLTKGRKVKLNLIADIRGIIVPGSTTFILPDSPDIEFVCTMKKLEPPFEIEATSAREAIKTVVETSNFGVNAGGLLELFMSEDIKFPFELAEVTAGGSTKKVADLKLAYDSGTTTTTGGTRTSGEKITFKVTIPLNGWNIDVK